LVAIRKYKVIITLIFTLGLIVYGTQFTFTIFTADGNNTENHFIKNSSNYFINANYHSEKLTHFSFLLKKIPFNFTQKWVDYIALNKTSEFYTQSDSHFASISSVLMLICVLRI